MTTSSSCLAPKISTWSYKTWLQPPLCDLGPECASTQAAVPSRTHHHSLGRTVDQSAECTGATTAAELVAVKTAACAASASLGVSQDENLVRLRLRMPAARHRRDGPKMLESAI